MTTWHQLTTPEAVRRLRSDSATGLTTEEAASRRARHGANQLVETGQRGPLVIVREQFSSAMVLLLFAAAGVSLYLGEFIDAGAILVILLLNAALGFFQDYRAERTLATLKRLSVPSVKARRDGGLCEIPAGELVPGDIVVLEVGQLVPADGRLLEAVSLRVDEASLTGESDPIEKTARAMETGDSPLGDRRNMAYMGTLVTHGHGVVAVTATGMTTELGHIAGSVQRAKPRPTPLQHRLTQLGRTLAVVAVGIVAVVFALGVAMGEAARLMLMTALSLAVAIVPEGLPAVATVALAIGARRMFRRHALIRKLPAVETLGSVTTICSDKTGTLTENRMTVSVLEVGGQRFKPPASPETPGDEPDEADGEVLEPEKEIDLNPAVQLLLAVATGCSDAELVPGSRARSFRVIGEPTEVAPVVTAARLGLVKPELTRWLPRVGEVPFDSGRKRMSTVHRVAGGDRSGASVPRGATAELLKCLDGAPYVVFTKGAVDAVLGCCRDAWSAEGTRVLDEEGRRRILESSDEVAGTGARVLGVAFRALPELPASGAVEEMERDLVFVGTIGMIDPPRAEAGDAVARCREAGIRPVMITGDHPLTALHIARELDIEDGGGVLVGTDLSRMSATDLERSSGDVSVYARVAPGDKLNLVEALQNQGQVVAMTGDGVNDAPALRQAHIGVAMGRVGTDVSKEASDMVLLDDNFATIVSAVEQGRIAYDNIRKFVKYTMTSNSGEVWVMVLGPSLGMPLPLLPLQILWVNLVTDGLPGLAFAVEPAERETMRRPPYPPGEPIMGRGMWRHIAWVGLLMGLVSLAMGYARWMGGTSDDEHWRTIVFTVLTLSQMGHALAVRSSEDSLFQIGLLSNLPLFCAVLLTFLLQLAVIYLPPLQTAFKTTALSLGELVSCLLLSTIVFWGVELEKLLTRMSRRRHEVS